jgi:hypothetical protein
MKIWWPRVVSNEKLWEMTGQININKETKKVKVNLSRYTPRRR